MQFFTKPIEIKLSVRALLIGVLVLALLITGFVLYKNYVFHNWFFQSLSADSIEAIYVYEPYGGQKHLLDAQETEAVAMLLSKIRLREEPYTNYKLVGNQGTDFHIRLKSGICFDLDLSGGDPGVYILDGKAYSIGYRDDPDAEQDFQNIWQMEALYEQYREKYCP